MQDKSLSMAELLNNHVPGQHTCVKLKRSLEKRSLDYRLTCRGYEFSKRLSHSTKRQRASLLEGSIMITVRREDVIDTEKLEESVMLREEISNAERRNQRFKVTYVILLLVIIIKIPYNNRKETEEYKAK